jgi:IS605 OrfB family transposase
MRTYQTRVNLSDQDSALLSEYACLYGKIERTLFAETISQNVKPESVKNKYLKRFFITARQFNAICRNLKGKCASIKERRKGLVLESKIRLDSLSKVVDRLEDKVKRAPNAVDIKKRKFTLHQKKRRLDCITKKLNKLISDHENGVIRLCFGSNKLFKAQFNLGVNGYESHEEWKTDWDASRSNQFYVLGSKDETAGCQGCVATTDNDGFLLRLRLPEALNAGNKYLEIPVDFSYGKEAIADALINKRAISYRFLRDEKGWRVFVSTKAIEFEKKSNKHIGAIGVDINAGHLAVNEIDRFGNPIKTLRIALNTYGLDSNQSSATIGDAVKDLMVFAAEKNKSIFIEELSFSKKKAELTKENKKYSRMLSSFSYGKIRSIIECRGHDLGIEVKSVNPAFTSIVGKFKFAKRYGISTHQAAACSIARRGLEFSERPNRRDYVASFLPVRNRNKHVWSYWGKVSRNKAALAALSSLASRQSRPPPLMDVG